MASRAGMLPQCDHSQPAGILDWELQMSKDDSINVSVASPFPGTVSGALWPRCLSNSLWFLSFCELTLAGCCRLAAISSLQVQQQVSCITTSQRGPDTPVFPYTQAPLRPHLGFISTSEGQILVIHSDPPRSHTEQHGGIKMEQICLPQAACKVPNKRT